MLAELDHFRQAEEWYLNALSDRPEDAVLLRQYGDLQWRMDRPLDARASYQRVLLSCPDDFPIDELQDSKLADIVERFGIEMAPVYGWIARILPFAEDAWDLPESRALGILRLIKKAENSRNRITHDQMIAYRKELMEKEPEVFSAYMARLT